MNQPQENSEFRNVHSAKAVLAAYIASEKDLNIIRSVKTIGRMDVWQCAFSEEKEAYRELQIKEFYQSALDNKDSKCAATLLVVLLNQIVEWKTPLSIEDAIKIILDVMGPDYRPKLLTEAKHHHETRIEIVKPYVKHDDEWVNYSKIVVDAIEQTVL